MLDTLLSCQNLDLRILKKDLKILLFHKKKSHSVISKTLLICAQLWWKIIEVKYLCMTQLAMESSWSECCLLFFWVLQLLVLRKEIGVTWFFISCCISFLYQSYTKFHNVFNANTLDRLILYFLLFAELRIIDIIWREELN